MEKNSHSLDGQILTPKILFEDVHLVVLSKPSGLLSQGEIAGDPNLVDWLRGHFGRHYVGLVHRLDRNTSGLMVVAKRSKSANRLTDALKSGDLTRKYQALVFGKITVHETWRHFLLKDSATNTVKIVREGTAGAKSAALSVKTLGHGEWKQSPLTHIQYELETGRSHQIRVQSAAMGHPLLGDAKYDPEFQSRKFDRLALHSCEIEFPHPMTKEIMKFTEELPKELKKVLK